MNSHLKEKQGKSFKSIYNRWLKDYLHEYARLFKQVSCHLDTCDEDKIYGQEKFKEFTFLQMYEWYEAHNYYQINPEKGSKDERKQAKDAFISVKYWLQVDKCKFEKNKHMLQFQKFVEDKEPKVSHLL